MAAGGLTKFIHGTQHNARTGSRVVPKKLVLDDVDNVYRYHNPETSDGSTQRGAFSTDLGSYPDTSLDEDQASSEGRRHLRFATSQPPGDDRVLGLESTRNGMHHETGTVISTQRGKRSVLNEHETTSNQPIQHQAAISALIGAGNIQQYEDFLQTWSTHKDPIEEPPENDVQVMPPTTIYETQKTALPLELQTVSTDISPRPEAIKSSRNPLPAQQIKSNSGVMAVPNVPARQPIFRHVRKAPANSLFPSQSRSLPREFANQQSGHDHVTTETSFANNDHADLSMSEHVSPTFSQQSPTTIPFEGQVGLARWKLRRPADLRDIRLDVSDQQLLSKQYSVLNGIDKSAKPKDGDAFFTDLDQVINSIANRVLDEGTLFSRLAQLDQDEWCVLGDKIQSRLGGVMNELKDLYAKKKSISLRYEEEMEVVMGQIGSNDKVVTNKLQKLRSFGARVLSDDTAIEEN